MNLGFLQLGLLFWKCWRTESRNKARLIAEIIVPLLMFVILAGFRVAFNLKTIQTECHFKAIPLPSAGAVPFLQGLVCNYENACQDNKTRSEDSRYPFGPAMITNIVRDTDIMYQKLTASPNDLLTDGSFVRLMRNLVVMQQVFSGRGVPEAYQQMTAITGIWTLLCDKPFNMSKSGSGSSPFGFGGGQSSTTTTTTQSNQTPLQQECNAFLRQFQMLKPIWNAVSSVLSGKIVYYPDTPIVRNLMQRVEDALDWETVFQNGIRSMVRLIQQAAANYQKTGATAVAATLASAGYVTPIEVQVLFLYLNSTQYAQLMQVDLPNFMRKMDCFRPSYPPASTPYYGSGNNSFSSSYYLATAASPATAYSTYTSIRNTTAYPSRLEGYDSVDNLIKQAMSYTAAEKLLGAVEFKDPEKLQYQTLPDLVRYAIRLDPSKLDSTKLVKDKAFKVQVRRDPLQSEMPYFTTGFIHLQDAVEKAIIALKATMSSGSNLVYATIGSIMQQFPFPCYMLDQFVANLSNSLLMFIVLGWIFPASMIVKSVVLEKERKLREVSRINGISPGLHFLSWFLFWMTVLIISVILFVLLIKGSGVFFYANPGIIFLIMVTYAASTIAFGFFISAFFSKANVGAVVGGLAYFMTYNAYGAISNSNAESLSLMMMMATSLMPNCALGFAWNVMARYELTTEGSQGSNFRTPISDEAEDQFTLFHGWIMLVIDTCIYYFIAWYVEYVFPGEYGVPRPFYFIFQPSFWCGECCGTRAPKEKKGIPAPPQKSDGPFIFEDEPTYLPVGASLHSIVKVYDFSLIDRLKLMCGKKIKQQRKAVDNFSLNMYEGQITALLGHNGAGKTTTMSIMCGLIAATKGSVTINNHDIDTEIEEVRKVLGFCPQFNVLYDDLTVAEHLWFYARIRGIEKSIIREDTERMLRDTNLTMKRNEAVKTLSGGMKRRLSIAVAFIGNSKCVILDEPTAGVDPYARRSLWDLLSKFRKDKTIILSTHHMDEAEVLADRIAVMSQGRLQTCGSPLFLKETCGDGYQLTISRKDKGTGAEGVDPKWEAQVTDFIKRQIPNSGLVDHINGELHYRLGYDMVPKFPGFLGALEKAKGELTVADIGLSDSTMEEIFIKMADMADEAATGGHENEAGENDDEEKEKVVAEEARPSSNKQTVAVRNRKTAAVVIPTQHTLVKLPDYKPLSGVALTSQQFWALLVKRYHRMRRNWKGFISELLLPIAFVLLGVAIIKIAEYKPGNAPTLEMQPWLMAPNSKSTREQRLYMFASQARPVSTLSRDIHNAAITSEYAGARCMDPSVYQIDKYPCNNNAGDSEWRSGTDRYRQHICECTKDGVQKCTSPSPLDPRNALVYNYGNVDYRLLRTTDDLLNLTGMDVSDYIVKQYQQLKSNFYGGFTYLVTPAMDATETTPSSFTTSSGLISSSAIMVWFNNKGYLSTVGYNNYANNMLLRLSLSPSSGASIPAINQYGIVGFNQPLNYTKEQFMKELTRSVIIDVMLAIMLILALSFVPASFVMFLIEDRVSDSKHVQIVSGLRPAVYWLGNYIWDCMNFIVPSVVCLIIFFAFDLQAYVNEKSIGALILLFLMYGFAVAPMLYPCSFFLDTPATAFVLLACANLFIGAGTTVATWFLDLFTTMDASIKDVNDILKIVFFIFPQYCLGRGLINMATSYRTAQGQAYFLGKGNFLDNHNPFDWSICGQFFFALALHLAGWFVVVLIIEYRMTIFRCWITCQQACSRGMVGQTPEPVDEDEDVHAEREAVIDDTGEEDSPYTMVVKNLCKVFKTSRGRMTAVNKLTFGVNTGHCFGLLGVNGAGKSTTFNMLTGRLLPTSGSATIRGYDILGARNEANKMIGYCPQYDCITPLLTGRENLEFFARLRGVPEKFVRETAECNVTRMDLLRHSEKPAGTYSGGNKRKLSTAIALTGEPPLIFLDEPTAGMDPRARRFLWRAIAAILLNGQSVVLTTHSMDECEALCTRLGIMVNGEFRCLGTTQHLKTRFGEGYLLNLRFKSDQRLASAMTQEFEAARKTLAEKFSDVALKEAHDNVAVYSIGAKGREPVKLGDLFGFLTNSSTASSLKIAEFSVMQSSLDAVFVTFAKTQTSDLSDAERKKAAEENEKNQVAEDGVSDIAEENKSDSGRKRYNAKNNLTAV